jgi:hypothetical protein
MGGPIEVSAKAREWQRRHDAACAVVARKYCDMFAFWRDCRYKPCRAARRCVGDQGACLQARCFSVPYDEGVAAHMRMIADVPPGADRMLRSVHHYPPTSGCLHDAKNQKRRAKGSDKSQVKA